MQRDPRHRADTIASVPSSELQPEVPALRTLAFATPDAHVLHVEEHGNPRGVAALVLHGGPGSGCSPLLRRGFDLQRYRVICVDQRGAGKSRPHGAIEHNSTPHLLADLERLREFLGIERWLVVGGSWGATLALAYAAARPEAISALLLRSTFLARRDDIDWFFQGAAVLHPSPWRRFAAAAPPERRVALLPWLQQTLAEGSLAEQAHAALAWWHWEQTLGGATTAAAPPTGEALTTLVGRYRMQSHYLHHDCWLTSPPLLQRCAAMPPVPTFLLHANNDQVCRAAGVLALHEQLPHSRLRWIDGAGHDAAHPQMLKAMVDALDCYAQRGHFDGATGP